MIPMMTISLFSWIAEPFMQHALLAMILLALSCSALGVHVVSFKMSFFSDAISHSVFTGIALGLILNISTSISTIIFGLLLAVILIQLGRRTNLSRDALIAVLLAIAVSLGIVLVSMRQGLVQNFQAALFGDILTVGQSDIIVLAVILLATVIFEIVGYNKLILISTSEAIARTHGINTKLWETLLALWIAAVVLVGLKTVGLLMITSFTVIPAASGRNFAKSASGSMLFALLIGVVSVIIGLEFSWQLNSSAGATVVLTSSLFFIVSLFFNSRKK